MTEYTFDVNGVYRSVEAYTEEEALKKAGIEEGGDYDLIDAVSFDDRYSLLAISNRVLNSSRSIPSMDASKGTAIKRTMQFPRMGLQHASRKPLNVRRNTTNS